VPLWLIEHPDVTGTAVRVYGELAGRYAEYRSGEAHVARAALAQKLALSVDTVDRALRILRRIGAVQITRRHTPNGHRTVSRYRVRLKPPIDPDAQIPPRVSYADYLQSDHWCGTRLRQLERAHFRCQVCNGAEALNVHHRTYRRLGAERPADLIVLCHGCHTLFHREGKLAREEER